MTPGASAAKISHRAAEENAQNRAAAPKDAVNVQPSASNPYQQLAEVAWVTAALQTGMVPSDVMAPSR